MKITNSLPVLMAAVACCVFCHRARGDTFGNGVNAFDTEFVTIGNPNNAADMTGSPNPAGAVTYTFRIGKFEISEQMIDMSNALGGLGLTKDNRAPSKPATSITWNEAARFVNWLNTSSGQPPAYKFAVQPGQAGYDANANIELWAPGDPGYNPSNLFRNSFARYFLPSVDEWYKAAYYDPVSGLYYNFPTGSDVTPDGIDFAGDLDFDAVFHNGGSNPAPNDITNEGILSPYGTAGQGGNVYEWEETNLSLVNDEVLFLRGIRGGFWLLNFLPLRSASRSGESPSIPRDGVGFRVVSAEVPEPSTASLLLTILFAFSCPQRSQHRMS